MAPIPTKSDCDTCPEHLATKLLLKQHEERLHDVEEHYMDISNDNSNLEGRVTIFIWIVGLSALLVCSIAFYGILQLDKFKAVYMADIKESIEITGELSSNVKTTQYSVSEVQSNMGRLQSEVRDIGDIQKEIQSEVKDIRQDIIDLPK